MFNINFYEDKNGNKPVKEYLTNLNSKALSSKNERIKLKKIAEYMDMLKRYGTRAGEPYVKHIED